MHAILSAHTELDPGNIEANDHGQEANLSQLECQWADSNALVGVPLNRGDTELEQHSGEAQSPQHWWKDNALVDGV